MLSGLVFQYTNLLDELTIYCSATKSKYWIAPSPL